MAKLVGSRILVSSSLLAMGISFTPVAAAQEPVPTPVREAPIVAPADSDRASMLLCLGRDLFHDGRLSSNGKVSCATCHDPAKSFADGIPQSKGVLGVEVGRNSPALWAVKHVALFPATVPPAPPDVRPGRGPVTVTAEIRIRRSTDLRAISLRDRCLGPIENPLEMGTTVAAVVQDLGKDAELQRRFDLAFNGSGGITADRLGTALAAYLESLDPPRTRYHDLQEGVSGVFTEEEKAGLEVFTTKGRCNACHSGAGLTDGLVHEAQPRNSARMERVRGASAKRLHEAMKQVSKSASGGSAHSSTAIQSLPGKAMRMLSGGYGGPEVQVQTPTLWDITRTAPYFRDGSEPALDAAIRTHVAELRSVRDRPSGGDSTPSLNIRPTVVNVQTVVIPEPLRPRWSDGQPAAPEELDAKDVARLVAFLRTLSPKTD